MSATAFRTEEREALLRVVTAASSATDLDEILEMDRDRVAGRRRRRFALDQQVRGRGPPLPGVDQRRRPRARRGEVPRQRGLRGRGLPPAPRDRGDRKPYFSSVDDPDADPETIELLRQFEKSSDMRSRSRSRAALGEGSGRRPPPATRTSAPRSALPRGDRGADRGRVSRSEMFSHVSASHTRTRSPASPTAAPSRSASSGRSGGSPPGTRS